MWAHCHCWHTNGVTSSCLVASFHSIWARFQVDECKKGYHLLQFLFKMRDVPGFCSAGHIHYMSTLSVIESTNSIIIKLSPFSHLLSPLFHLIGGASSKQRAPGNNIYTRLCNSYTKRGKTKWSLIDIHQKPLEIRDILVTLGILGHANNITCTAGEGSRTIASPLRNDIPHRIGNIRKGSQRHWNQVVVPLPGTCKNRQCTLIYRLRVSYRTLGTGGFPPPPNFTPRIMA